jgi:uncharacterized 2Fe-2S/4Fe-4S cluster protein (DUF4445 family)
MSNTANNEYKIAFMPSGKRGNFPEGTKILAAARELGVDIDTVCGGRALCGRCQVEFIEGEFAKHGISSKHSNISARSDAETKFATRKNLGSQRRLSCQSRLLGDIVVDVPQESQLHQQLVRKEFEATEITINASIHLHYIELADNCSTKRTNALNQIKKALKDQWSLTDLNFIVEDWKTILPILKEGEGKCTVAVRNKKELIAIFPGFVESCFGAAIDIGSTTIAINLCNLTDGSIESNQGSMNPQIRFGEDLMSRVSYCMQNPGSQEKLTQAVRTAVNELIHKACDETEINPELILEITIVGNPVMHHLFLGFDPVPLGLLPFTLATDKALHLRAEDLGIDINKHAGVYVLPCLAGHVGADAAAVILTEKPYRQKEINLIVDVGTNAEIIVGNQDKLLAASSPTGPAFEGAQINSGQRAAPGAIERVRINPENFEPKFKVIGSEYWSDEIEFEESIKKIGITGICGSGIIEAVAGMYLAGIISQDGLMNKSLINKTERLIQQGRTFSYFLHRGTPEVLITQNDIRAIQLAKAALYAGAKLLMDKLSVEKVDKIRLAGAFGSHIDVKYAMILGMIPDCKVDMVTSAGNAASTGARMALLDTVSRDEIENEIRKIEKIETAIETKFQEYFVHAMAIPHQIDDFSELSKIVNLPEKIISQKPKRRRQPTSS